MVAAFEWSGSLLGLLGAFLLATHSSVSRYGWLAFLAANVAMIAFASAIGAYGLLVQQLGFTCTSLLGFHRAWLRPAPVAELPARKASAKSWAPRKFRGTRN